MGYHPRIESSEKTTFITVRTVESRLWLANNPRLEEYILGQLAKIVENRSVILYAFAIEGSHIHVLAKFPLKNRYHFCRDLNSSIARGVKRFNSHYEGGRLWHRRYSGELLEHPEDIEHWFYYTALQPVQDGLVEKTGQYPFYNCFHDAVSGIKTKYKVFDWAAYNDAKRYNINIQKIDFTREVYLEFSRLPGHEELSQKEYKEQMYKKLEERRQIIIEDRKTAGKNSFLGKRALLKIRPGQKAKNPKTSTIFSHRPRVLSICPKRRAEIKAWYFSTYEAFKKASLCYLAGDLLVEFPAGTFRPPIWLVALPAGPFSVLGI